MAVLSHSGGYLSDAGHETIGISIPLESMGTINRRGLPRIGLSRFRRWIWTAAVNSPIQTLGKNMDYVIFKVIFRNAALTFPRDASNT